LKEPEPGAWSLESSLSRLARRGALAWAAVLTRTPNCSFIHLLGVQANHRTEGVRQDVNRSATSVNLPVIAAAVTWGVVYVKAGCHGGTSHGQAPDETRNLYVVNSRPDLMADIGRVIGRSAGSASTARLEEAAR